MKDILLLLSNAENLPFPEDRRKGIGNKHTNKPEGSNVLGGEVEGVRAGLTCIGSGLPDKSESGGLTLGCNLRHYSQSHHL